MSKEQQLKQELEQASTEKLVVRLAPVLKEKLSELAKEAQCSMSEWVRRQIREA